MRATLARTKRLAGAYNRRHRGIIAMLSVATWLLLPAGPSPAQSPPGRENQNATTADPTPAGRLRFNFAGSDWRTVLEWFAEQADLSLQVDQTPLGTFSFADASQTYSVSESLDLLNLSLMKRGYSLVRRGRLLQVIDLEAENADKLISEIAQLVTPPELEGRGKSDIVSCVFPLGGMTPGAAREELAQLIGPWGRIVVLESARQVKVTETASKLIAIGDLLLAAQQVDTEVTEIVLQHRSAEELLEIARPLLSLPPGENADDQIRISVGPLADRIYATGWPSKTALLKSLIAKADAPLAVAPGGDPQAVLPVLQAHPISAADPATVFDVLQTLLAGTPDARIAVDPRTKSVVARARPEIQNLIEASIAELEGQGQDFKIFQLKRLDPTQAFLTINKFFGVTAQGGEGPIVDGDPATGRLWVRGTADQIVKVQQLISELEANDQLGGGLGDKVRILPYRGASAENALLQAKNLWPITGRKNSFRFLSPRSAVGNVGAASSVSAAGEVSAAVDGATIESGRWIENAIPERRIFRPDDVRRSLEDRGDDTPVDRKRSGQAPADETNDSPDTMMQVDGCTELSETMRKPRAVTADLTLVSDNDSGRPGDNTVELSSRQVQNNDEIDADDIVVQITPAGLVVASEDTDALQALEALLQSLAAPDAATSDLPTIYWLKYVQATTAAELVASILGGGDSSLGGVVDSAAGDLGGGMLGGLIGSGGSGDQPGASEAKSVSTSSGRISLVPDARLNALIVQANATDLRMVEMILEKIDRADSPEDVQTKGRPAMIPVVHQDAADVAKVVKEVLGDRIEGQSSQNGGQSNDRSRRRQASPRDLFAALRGGDSGRTQDKETVSQPAKISIAVDVTSNALVVVATPADLAMVRDLVQQIDEGGIAGEETVMTYTLGGDMNPEVMRLALESILGVETQSTRSDRAAGATSGSPGQSGNSTSSGGFRSRAASDSRDRSAAELQQRVEFFRALRSAGGGQRGGGAGQRGSGDPQRRGGGQSGGQQRSGGNNRNGNSLGRPGR